MRKTVHILKALTDETRLRILALLAQGELCVCDLMEALQLPQSTVSRHLALLKNGDWITDRRQGIWMYYRLTDEADPFQAELRQTLQSHLKTLPVIQNDLARLTQNRRDKNKNACQ